MYFIFIARCAAMHYTVPAETVLWMWYFCIALYISLYGTDLWVVFYGTVQCDSIVLHFPRYSFLKYKNNDGCLCHTAHFGQRLCSDPPACPRDPIATSISSRPQSPRAGMTFPRPSASGWHKWVQSVKWANLFWLQCWRSCPHHSPFQGNRWSGPTKPLCAGSRCLMAASYIWLQERDKG